VQVAHKQRARGVELLLAGACCGGRLAGGRGRAVHAQVVASQLQVDGVVSNELVRRVTAIDVREWPRRWLPPSCRLMASCQVSL